MIMKKAICAILILMVITVSGAGVRAYTTQTPIRIDSNGDFSTYASSGNGTIENPWNITDQEINGTGYGYCIYVGNTTDYFTINNCYLHDANINNPDDYFRSNSGIILNNVDNGVIESNEIVFNDYGIYLLGVSENNVIQYNNISSNLYSGIEVDNADNNQIYRNTADYNEIGIHVLESSLNEIEDNIAFYNDYALKIDQSDDNIIIQNSFCLSDNYGAYIDSQSCANGIFSNNFGNNAEQAHDAGNGNRWNDSYQLGGNYWNDANPDDDYLGPNQSEAGSDGFGDSEYAGIGGGRQDSYQRMEGVDTFGIGKRDEPDGIGKRDEPD